MLCKAKTVNAYLKSQQSLPFGFPGQLYIQLCHCDGEEYRIITMITGIANRKEKIGAGPDISHEIYWYRPPTTHAFTCVADKKSLFCFSSDTHIGIFFLESMFFNYLFKHTIIMFLKKILFALHMSFAEQNYHQDHCSLCISTSVICTQKNGAYTRLCLEESTFKPTPIWYNTFYVPNLNWSWRLF